MPLAKEGVSQTPRTYVLNTLGFEQIDPVAAIGAGVANTTVQTHTIFPCNFKISKIAVSLTAIDAVAGGDSFNLVVGGLQGQTAQAYNQNTAAPNDNSFTHNAANAVGSDSLGFPTNIAAAGMTVFANDVTFNSANVQTASGVAGDLMGRAQPNTGWISLATTGGYGIFVPTNYDAVYPAGVPLSLRVTTVASTGSISNLRVMVLIEPMGLRAGPTPSSTYYQATPGIDF